MIMLRCEAVCPLTQSFMGNSVVQRNQRPSRRRPTACAWSSNRTTPCPREASKLTSFLVSIKANYKSPSVNDQIYESVKYRLFVCFLKGHRSWNYPRKQYRHDVSKQSNVVICINAFTVGNASKYCIVLDVWSFAKLLKSCLYVDLSCSCIWILKCKSTFFL